MMKNELDYLQCCYLGMHRCTKKWRSILTPQGVCDILQVENKNEIVEYSLNLAVGINYTDSTFGWHGARNGIVLYYFDRQHFQR